VRRISATLFATANGVVAAIENFVAEGDLRVKGGWETSSKTP